MDTFFYRRDYYLNLSCLVFLVWNDLKMRFPTICVSSKVGMNTITFCFIKTRSRCDFTRSCDGLRAIFSLTSVMAICEKNCGWVFFSEMPSMMSQVDPQNSFHHESSINMLNCIVFHKLLFTPIYSLPNRQLLFSLLFSILKGIIRNKVMPVPISCFKFLYVQYPPWHQFI